MAEISGTTVIPPSGNSNEGKTELDILNEPVEKFDKGDEDESSDDETEDGDDTDKSDDESPDDESEDDTSDETDEDKEESEDDEETPEEDDVEVTDEVTKNLYQKLKTENPELFKKHPELRAVIFREQQYTELFPSVDEAKDVKEKYDAFSELEATILAGEPDTLLASIQGTDKEAFENFAHNLLPAILKQSKDVYSSMLEVPLKRAIQQAYVNARNTGNENLMNSALYVDQFFFGADGISKDPDSAKRGSKKEEKKSPEVERLEAERNEHAERIKGEFNSSVIETIQFKLRKEIGLNLDKYEFDTYKKKNVTRDIENEVNNILAADKRYQASIRSLYNQASTAKFSSDWKTRISSAYLARARAVLPLAKKKVIADATGRSLGNEGLKVKKRLTPTNLSSRAPQKLDASRIDRSKTTDADILSDDPARIKYKK